MSPEAQWFINQERGNKPKRDSCQAAVVGIVELNNNVQYKTGCDKQVSFEDRNWIGRVHKWVTPKASIGIEITASPYLRPGCVDAKG